MLQSNTLPEKHHFKLLIICFFISNPFISAQYQDKSCIPVLLSPDNEKFLINTLVYYLEDKENILTIDDLFKPETEDRFIKSSSSSLDFGYTNSAYWVKFCMKNPQPEINDWLLEIGYVHLDSIHYFQFIGDTLISEKQFGDMFPFRQRELDYRTFIIPLYHPDTLVRTYFLRFKTQSSMQFPMTVYSEKTFIKNNTSSGIYYGILMGTMAVLLILNLSGYFSLRDISYLHCVMILLSATLFIALMSGYFFQYFLKNSPWFINHLLPFTLALMTVSTLFFTRSFLKTRKYSIALNTAITCFLIFWLIALPAVFFTSYNFSMRLFTSVVILNYIFYVISGIVCLLKGNRAARLYIFAAVLMFVGAMLLTLKTKGLLPDNPLTSHAWEFVFIPYGMLLFMALTDKYKISIADNEKALKEINLIQQEVNVSLEIKVRERTEELKTANLRLEEHQKEIEEVNTLLEEQKEELMQQKEELQSTLENLQKTQEQLVESEKMAAIGGLVAGVAHEMNTPVGIGITAISNLLEDVQKMAGSYEKDEISRKDFKGFLESTHDAAKLIQKNLERAASLIQSFKQVSTDQITEQQRVFALKEYLNDILLSLRPKFREKRIAFKIECDDELQLNSYPGVYAQIFTNLLLNSLQHGFHKRDMGTIGIKAEIINDLLKIRYTDDGSGINKKDLPHIFEPFFTSDQHRGTGLGLNIIYNLVKQKLHGTITCESEPGKGVLFEIEVPVK